MKARGDMGGAYELIAEAERKLSNIGESISTDLSAFKTRIRSNVKDSETVDNG